MDQQLQEFEERLGTQLNARFEKIDQRFDAADQRTQALEAIVNAGFAGVATRFTETDARIDAVAGQLDAKIDTVAGQLDAKIDAVAGQLDAKIDTVAGRLDAKIDTVAGRLDAKIDAVAGQLDAKIDTVGGHFDALDLRVGVLHEDVIARIAGASERKAVTEDQFFAAMADLKKTFGGRLDPLEAAVREHSRDIAELKRTRQ